MVAHPLAGAQLAHVLGVQRAFLREQHEEHPPHLLIFDAHICIHQTIHFWDDLQAASVPHKQSD